MKKIILFIICSITSICSYANFSVSDSCIEHIKKYESCRLIAYWDSNGYSIGYGHHGDDVKQGMKISQKQADKFLNEDIKKAENAANRLIKNLPYKYNFSQNFFDGLVDLIYNCGEGGVKASAFYQRLNKCRINNGIINKADYDFTLAAVKTCRVSCKGHIKRRQEVYRMMMF